MENRQEDFDFEPANDIEVVSADFNEPVEMNNEQPNEEQQQEQVEQLQEQKKKNKEEVEIDVNDIDVNEPVTDDNDDYYDRLYNEWVENGFIRNGYEKPEDHHLTSDELSEMLKRSRYDDAVEIYKNEIESKFVNDPETMEFLKFKMNGGKTSDFVKAYSQSEDIGEMDLSNTANQDIVLREYYKRMGFDDNQIADQITMLHDSGKSEEYARKGIEAINEANKRQREQLNEQLKKEQEEAEKQRNAIVSTYLNEISAMDSINGVKLSDDRKRNLVNLLTGNVRLNDGTVVNALVWKINEIMSDPKKAIAFAEILDSNLDFSRYERAIETKKTREISRNLINNKSGKPMKGKSGGEDWF